MWNRKNRKVTRIDSLIGQSTEINGNIVFSGGLHIDGTVKGNITAQDDSGSVLTLSGQGAIKGEVRVPNIILNGVVIGNVYAAEHIELAPNARVTGDVYYTLIEMAMGAEVNGSLVHSSETNHELPLSLEHSHAQPEQLTNMHSKEE